MSTKPEIRHMLDNYRDMEMQKYVSYELTRCFTC